MGLTSGDLLSML